MIVIVARFLLQWDSSMQNKSNEACLKSLSPYSFLLVVETDDSGGKHHAVVIMHDFSYELLFPNQNDSNKNGLISDWHSPFFRTSRLLIWAKTTYACDYVTISLVMGLFDAKQLK